MRALSLDEIEAARGEIMALTPEQEQKLAEHTESLRPKRSQVQDISLNSSGTLNGLGLNPCNESERKMLEACNRDGISWADKKTRLLRMRADMLKLKPVRIL